MIKKKTYVKNVFDEEILRPGLKVLAKYRSCISLNINENDYWDREIEGKISQCDEENLWIEDLNDGHFGMFDDKWYPYQHNIDIESIKYGFWKIEFI